MPAWLPLDRLSRPCACWGRGDVRLRCAVDALAAVPPTTSTCQIPSPVDIMLGDESGIELRHRYPGLATDPLLGQLPVFLKNKKPSALSKKRTLALTRTVAPRETRARKTRAMPYR